MGNVYDALLRAESNRCESSPIPVSLRPPTIGPAGRQPDDSAPSRSDTADDPTPLRVDGGSAEANVTDRDVLERLASLEVAVYALLDRLDRDVEDRPLRQETSLERATVRHTAHGPADPTR